MDAADEALSVKDNDILYLIADILTPLLLISWKVINR